MNSIRIGLVQMEIKSADVKENLYHALEMAEEAARKKADIICLPELFMFKYFPQERNNNVIPEKIPNEATEIFSRLAKKYSVGFILGSLYEKADDGYYNTSVLINEEGNISGKYRKIHLPDDECFYERNYFKSGNEYVVSEIKKVKVGVLICFDQWYPEPARILKLMGADIIFYPSAIGSVKGIEETEGSWKEAWESVQRGHAISNSIIIATVNRVGREKRINFWGSSFVYDQFGKKIASGSQKEQIILADCNLDLAEEIEKGWGFIRNRKPRTYGEIVKDENARRV